MRVLKLYQIKLTQLMVDGHAFTHVMRWRHGPSTHRLARWDQHAPPRRRVSQLATAKALEAADDALPWCELA